MDSPHIEPLEPQALRYALSIPLNGFSGRGRIFRKQSWKLSIPLNGFEGSKVKVYNERGEIIPFNSIEWIHRYGGWEGLRQGRTLSIPLNGFGWGLVGVGLGSFYLSIPLNGFEAVHRERD